MKQAEYRAAAACAMSEDDLHINVTQLADVFKWLWWHDNDSRKNKAGLLDLILLRPPRLIFSELKTERGRMRKMQTVWYAGLARVPHIETYLWRPRHLLSGEIQKVLQ